MSLSARNHQLPPGPGWTGFEAIDQAARDPARYTPNSQICPSTDHDQLPTLGCCSAPCSWLPTPRPHQLYIHIHLAKDRMNDNCSEATTPRIASSSSSNPFSFPQPRTPSSSSSLLQDEELCIIGGGTGCNTVVGAFVGAKRITYCLPVSDDGGSSSEIQRVLGQLPLPFGLSPGQDRTLTRKSHAGGPALGDIRSRLIRLIPSAPAGSPLDCIRRLLEYRLPGGVNTTNVAVKQEWGDIVEGTHRLWRVSSRKRSHCAHGRY